MSAIVQELSGGGGFLLIWAVRGTKINSIASDVVAIRPIVERWVTWPVRILSSPSRHAAIVFCLPHFGASGLMI